MKELIGSPLPLGCTVKGNEINFSISLEKNAKGELILYKKGSDIPVKTVKLHKDFVSDQIRFCAVALEDGEEFEYNFKVDDQIVCDPYGRDFTGREVWNEPKKLEEHQVRTLIVKDEFDWEGDTFPRLKMEDVVAYSVHVRGYTKHTASQVKHKGTFRGLIEKIPYFLELGVNQIHCMPVYDFEENLKYLNYWGYGEGNYFAPKASYASDNPVTEVKEMIKSMHKAGIEVIFEMPFDYGVNQSFMLECLRFWSREYHVDGFLINPSVCNWNMITEDPQLSGLKIFRKNDDFQNIMRRFLKGDEGMIPEVISRLKHSSEDGCLNYITSQNGFTLNDLVSYDEKHNELNGENNQDGPDRNYSWNCGVEGASRRKSVVALRKHQMFNAMFLLLLAQGTPCILGGDEFCNSQKGNNNVYCQDNLLSWTDWKKYAQEKEMYSFVKNLISFRKGHKMLTLLKEEECNTNKSGIPSISYHGESAWRLQDHLYSRQLGVFYHEEKEDADDVYIAYNMHWKPHMYALPNLPKGKKWYLAGTTQDGILEETVLVSEEKEIEIKERTICVFIGK